jgi:glycosyltransferase involved in cell wall biosynthesis
LHDIQAFEPDLPWSHTWQHRWFAYKWGRWVRKALTDCRVVFTVSEFSKQRMVDLLGANPNQIEVIGNGVDAALFEIANIDPATLIRPIDRPYIIIVGGLREKKGADDVLAVAHILCKRHSDLQIVVAGNSEPDYIAAAKEHPNITLLGIVSDLDLPRLLRCASSLLFLSPYEGFGIPALEAMAAGIPAVVSDRASLPEIVGDAGIIVDPTIPEAIVDILIDLDKMPHLREDYIQRGHRHVAKYTWASCVDRLVTAFHTFA